MKFYKKITQGWSLPIFFFYFFVEAIRKSFKDTTISSARGVGFSSVHPEPLHNITAILTNINANNITYSGSWPRDIWFRWASGSIKKKKEKKKTKKELKFNGQEK